MKLLLFSDLHRDLDAAGRLVERAADVDVVLGAGDFGTMHTGVNEIVAALGAIERPAVIVPGNAETDEELAVAARAWPSATTCHGTSVDIDGRTFFGLGGGIPVTPWEWSFDVDDDDARRILADCPHGAVLVLHSPPYDCVDGSRGHHLGSPAIRDAIVEKQPPLVVCGHIHECWEQEGRIGSSRVINAGPRGVVVDL